MHSLYRPSDTRNWLLVTPESGEAGQARHSSSFAGHKGRNAFFQTGLGFASLRAFLQHLLPDRITRSPIHWAVVVTFLSMSIVAEIFSDEEMGALAGYWRRRQFFWTLCGP